MDPGFQGEESGSDAHNIPIWKSNFFFLEVILEQKPRALTTETKSEGKRSALLINTVDTQQIHTE